RRPGSRWRLSLGTAAGVLVILGTAVAPGTAPAKAAPSGSSPDQAGSWTAPFEEGGINTPRCLKGTDGRLTCKPDGYAQAITPDGRVCYFKGIGRTETVQHGPTAAL